MSHHSEPSTEAQPIIGPALSLVLRVYPTDPAGAAQRASGDRWHVPQDTDDVGAPAEEALEEAPSDSEPESDAPSSTGSIIQTPPSSPVLEKNNVVKDSDTPYDPFDSEYGGYRRAGTSNRGPSWGNIIPSYFADIGSPRDASQQRSGYYVRMSIKQPHRTGDFPPFRFHIDTGSSLTWALANGYEELQPNGHCDVCPPEWDEHTLHQSIWDHDYNVSDARARGLTYELNYADRCKVLLVLPMNRRKSENSSELLALRASIECYNHDTQRWLKPIVIPYVFALAIAINKKMNVDIFDGTLGLGLATTQGSFGPKGHEVTYPSILYALQNHVPEPSFSQSPGTTLFFGLRPIPRFLRDDELPAYVSFVAINRWPCPKVPPFSRNIRVFLDGDERSWDVLLTGIQLFDWDPQKKSYATPKTITLPKLEDRIVNDSELRGARAVRVLLDTGSSVSWLPDSVIRQIASHYGARYKRAKEPITEPSFIVPKGRHHANHQVRLAFHALAQSDVPVKVDISAEYFIYAAHPETGQYEGLLYATTSDRNVLGVNWFHGNWVEMCAPKTGPPYVRLAPQRHEGKEVNEYQLPPIASSE